jgi:hypothetical protein
MSFGVPGCELASIKLAGNIRCNQAVLRGQTNAGMQAINDTDQDGTASEGRDDVNALRQILGLPQISN